MEKDLYKKSFSLIKQAILDNFQKPNIWKKGVDFCRATGYYAVDELFDMLWQLYDDKNLKKLTRSTYFYLYCTLIDSICKNIINAYQIINSKKSTYDEIRKAKNFIERVHVKNSQLRKKYDFVQNMLQLFESTKDMMKKNIKNLEIDKIIYQWWCYKRLNHDYIDFHDFAESTYAVLCENKSYSRIMQKIILLSGNYLKIKLNENLFEDVYTNIINSLNKLNVKIGEKEININNERLTIEEWIQYFQKLASDNKTAFDLRISEYFSLQIIKEVCKYMAEPPKIDSFATLESIFDFDNRIILPQNFVLEFKEFKTWESIKNEVCYKINYHSNIEEDIRYSPEFYTDEIIDNEKKNIYSIGVMLCQLLAKDLRFSSKMNICERIEKPYYYIIDKIKNLPISSYTYAIILACLTTRYYEASFIGDYIKLVNREDTDKDPIQINSINNLIEHIDNSQRILEFHQMNIDGHSPRQLIPVSFLQLNRNQNPYYEVKE